MFIVDDISPCIISLKILKGQYMNCPLFSAHLFLSFIINTTFILAKGGKMKKLFFPVLLAALIHASSIALYAQAKLNILPQRTTPIKIEKFETQFKTPPEYRYGAVVHKIAFKNVTRRVVDAVQFRIISFDVFEGIQNNIAAVCTEPLLPGMPLKGEWYNDYEEAFMFGRGILYVEKVKYIDGELWEADAENILYSMKDIREDFKTVSFENPPSRFLNMR